MARILVITSGITSIVNSSVAMALRLQKDGHEVSYGSFANIGLTIRSANLTFIKLPNLQNLTENPATDIEVLKSEIARLTTIFDHKKYDLSIIDIECHEFIVSSPNFSEKLVLLSTFLSLWRRPGLIPLHLATHPDTSNPLNRSTFSLIWFRYLASKILRSRISKIKKRGKDRLSYLAKLSSYSEFPWKEKKDETQWLKPVFYKDIAVLNLNDPELDFPHTPNTDALYVGPMINIDRAEKSKSLTRSEQSRLQSILDRNKIASNRYLVYCAFGRFKKSYDDSFIHKITDTARQRPDWDFLISLGGHETNSPPKDAPANAHLFQWLPQTTVLLQSDCAVIHSGISTINECIYAEVPMVLYSLGIRDQQGNAARVAFHNLGLCGNREKDSSYDIEKFIMSATQSREISTALTEFNQQARQFKKQNVLESTVNRILTS